MFDLHKEMNEFYSDHVRLSEDEKKKLAEYRDINLKRLKAGLDKLGEENSVTYQYYQYHRNQGSYAMGTLNQHPDNDYDIDVAIIFKKDSLPSSASDARNRIADAMKKGGGNFLKDPYARTNAVTIVYAEGYHIDFAIYREYQDQYNNTIIEHAGPDWTIKDPIEITTWFNQRVQDLSPRKELGATVETNQMRRIVRLLKVFAKSRSSWSLPGGMIISALVAECYQPDYHRDDVSLYNTMVAIRNRLLVCTQVTNPVDPQQMLTSKTKYEKQVERFRDRLVSFIPKLDVLFEDDCTKQKAMKAWNWIFRHPFWSDNIDEETESVTESLKALPIGEFETVTQLANWKDGFLIGYYPNGDDAYPLPKNIWLRFSVKNISVKWPYEIRWIVQNYGDEAEEAQDMGHEANSSVQWERTAYKGHHTMTCVLHRNGVVLARAMQVVKIQR